MRHLLLVEDDAFIRTFVNAHLSSIGYHVEMAINLEMAKDKYQKQLFDLILLDLTLPDGNGFDWVKELRKTVSKPPIIYLTSHTHISDVKKGFELGGSDYIKKPFDLEELTVRIKHAMRDFNTGAGQDVQIGEYKYNPTCNLLTYKDTCTHLGQLQGAVLKELSINIGAVVTKEYLLTKHWGEANYFTSRNLDSVIVKLRNHFKNDERVHFIALKRKGYQLLIHDKPLS